jgi:hypothetical protein
MVRYSFPVRLFHPLLHAGLNRRFLTVPYFLYFLTLVGAPLLRGSVYRYPFTGQFGPGAVSVQVLPGSFFDRAGNPNPDGAAGSGFTLLDDDGTVTETNAGTARALFTVALAAPSQQTIRVNYATTDGTATVAGKDYDRARGVLIFKPGTTYKTVSVNVRGDRRHEDDETFRLLLSSATPGALVQNFLVGTIVNDDPVPSLSISDVSIQEGQAGTRIAKITVSLSRASGKPVTVAYQTVDGSATTADGDYQAAAGALTFNPGQTRKTISVPIVGDRRFEGHETFTVNLAEPTGATLARGTATGTIRNDDKMPAFYADRSRPVEANITRNKATGTVQDRALLALLTPTVLAGRATKKPTPGLAADEVILQNATIQDPSFSRAWKKSS